MTFLQTMRANLAIPLCVQRQKCKAVSTVRAQSQALTASFSPYATRQLRGGFCEQEKRLHATYSPLFMQLLTHYLLTTASACRRRKEGRIRGNRTQTSHPPLAATRVGDGKGPKSSAWRRGPGTDFGRTRGLEVCNVQSSATSGPQVW